MISTDYKQARHNFSKTDGAAQKLGGQNIRNYLTFKIFGRNFKENRPKSQKTGGPATPLLTPLQG